MITLKLSPSKQDDMDSDAEWVEKVNMPPSMSKKIIAIKVCRNRCLAHATSETALDMATPVLRMLFALLEHGGTLHVENEDELIPPLQTCSDRTELIVLSQP
jgi:sister chromatid cohesion protein PDS5